jgi:hypothetical protein
MAPLLRGRREHSFRRERTKLAVAVAAPHHVDPFIAGDHVAHVRHEFPFGRAKSGAAHLDCVPGAQSRPCRQPPQVVRNYFGVVGTPLAASAHFGPRLIARCISDIILSPVRPSCALRVVLGLLSTETMMRSLCRVLEEWRTD